MTFVRENIYTKFSQNQEVLNTQFQTVFDYLKLGSSIELDHQFFSREDILHMQDVQRLYFSVQLLLLTAVLVFIASLLFKTKSKDNSSFVILLVVPVSLLLAYILSDFDHAFIQFHQLLFPHNTYWALDPTTSNLIKFFPVQIFQELGLIWLIGACASFIALTKATSLLDTD